MTPEQIQKITHSLWMMAQLLSEEDFKKVKPYMEEINETLKEVDGETPRGYWIEDHFFIKCSLCGAYSLDGTSKSHFCSNCGAVMMKGDQT